MFAYERQVVSSMLTTSEATTREEVVAFVDQALRSMPEFLRAGLVALTVGLTAWAGVRGAVGGRRSAEAELAWLKGHPVGLVRQWTRALQSLVLFAENEKEEARACA